MEETMTGQRLKLWVFLMKTHGFFAVNLFEESGHGPHVQMSSLGLDNDDLSSCYFCSHLALGGGLLGCSPAANTWDGVKVLLLLSLIIKIPGYDYFQL